MSIDEATRFADFCQFKTEIRGSGQYLIVGIDVTKDKHHAFFGMANGRTLSHILTAHLPCRFLRAS